MKRVSILFILILVFQAFCLVEGESNNYIPLNQDKTLTNEQYLSLNIPVKISSPEDILLINKQLSYLLETNPEQLPRYNSRKSSSLFVYLTSHQSIDDILKTFNHYKEQQTFLLNYFGYGQTLADIYCIASMKYDYENEYLLCSSARLYANIRFLELFESEVVLSGQSINEILDEKFKNLFSQQIGRSFWGLSQMVKYNTDIDSFVVYTITNDLNKMKSRIIKLESIDQSIVFDPDKCWE